MRYKMSLLKQSEWIRSLEKQAFGEDTYGYTVSPTSWMDFYAPFSRLAQIFLSRSYAPPSSLPVPFNWENYYSWLDEPYRNQLVRLERQNESVDRALQNTVDLSVPKQMLYDLLTRGGVSAEQERAMNQWFHQYNPRYEYRRKQILDNWLADQKAQLEESANQQIAEFNKHYDPVIQQAQDQIAKLRWEHEYFQRTGRWPSWDGKTYTPPQPIPAPKPVTPSPNVADRSVRNVAPDYMTQMREMAQSALSEVPPPANVVKPMKPVIPIPAPHAVPKPVAVVPKSKPMLTPALQRLAIGSNQIAQQTALRKQIGRPLNYVRVGNRAAYL